MVLKTRAGTRREVRMPEFGTSHLIPPPWSGGFSSSGELVTTDSANGLPAVGRAVRLIGGLTGTALLTVFVGRRGDKRELPDSPQARLFESPYPGMSSFEWRYDVAVSLEVAENAFLRKIKTGRGELVGLQPIPPKWVNARVDENGEKSFEISTSNGWKRVDSNEILHIRGQTPDGGAFGVSRFHQHRDPVGAMLAAQKFEGSYFRNHARPDLALLLPTGVTQEQKDQWKASWEEFKGAGNAGKALVMGAGTEIVPIPFSMRDAQFIESKGMTVADVARIMDVEELLLGGGQAEQQDVQAMDRFLAFQLPPRLARIASALKADPDVFALTDLSYPEFAAEPLMFASPSTRAEVQHSQIQAGTLLPDEARADNGRPPLPDGLGQIPQVTPVGGAPNPAPLPDTPDEENARGRELAIRERDDNRMALEIRDGLLALAAGIRDQKPVPVNVDVHIPEPPPAIVNVEAAPAPFVETHVHVPEQLAPVVNVQPAAIEVRVPEQAAPVVNVPAPVVNVAVEPTPVTVEHVVNVPKLEVAPVDVVVNVPEQRLPDIHVAAPAVTVENRAPEMVAPNVTVNVEPTPVTVEAPVTVNVPEAAPPIVMVENTIEAPNKRITLERDGKGNLKGAKVEDDA